MRIVNAHPTATRRWRAADDAQERAARFERLGLAVTSLVLLFGLWLTYVEQTATFSTFAADVQNGALVNLSSIRDESALVPHLTMFTERAERAAVAAAVLQRVQGTTDADPIEHIGALASVTIPSRPRVFSGADIAELKRVLVVRTPGEFRRRIEIAIAVFMLAF